MLELYIGNGKGKSTAAAGLALRAVGNDIPVIYTQFMKDGSSGEMTGFSLLPLVSIFTPDHFFGFSRTLTPDQRQILKNDYMKLLLQISDYLKESKKEPDPEETGFSEKDIFQVCILDEALSAEAAGLLPLESLLSFIKETPSSVELILTGRSAKEEILSLADYISDIQAIRHPYPVIKARKGIEY